MTLGLRIRTLRKALKLTQQDLADATEVSRIYIQALESNRRSPSMKLLHRLAEKLGVDASDLLEEFPKDSGGRLQLEELFSGPEPVEIWYRSHKLTPGDVELVHKLIEVALTEWSGEKRGKAKEKRN